jgi:hypothetical protein
MSAEDRRAPAEAEDAAPASAAPRGTAAGATRHSNRSTAGFLSAVLWTLMKIAFVLGVIGVIGFIALALWIQGQFPAPKGVPAPVAWTTQQVVLSHEAPILEGRLTLTTTAAGSTDSLRVGVNAGVASAGTSSVDADPRAILAGPAARLTASAPASLNPARSCLAPCELDVPEAFACSAERCEMTVDVTIELVRGDLDGEVHLPIAGGLTAPVDSPLLKGLIVDFAIGDATTPEPG